MGGSRSMRSRACTPKANERPGDLVAAEAIDALRKLREENLRLREENVEIREVSMASQSLAEEAVKMARSVSPVRSRPGQKLAAAITNSPPLSGGGTPSARSNPRLLGRFTGPP